MSRVDSNPGAGLAPAPPAVARTTSFGTLERTAVPLEPSIALWLLSADVDLEATCQALATSPAPPYWAFCWGAGQALAHYLTRHPEEVRGRDVVDLGSGSGVVAIAAARAGARSVTAVDLDPAARRAIGWNAQLNGVRIRTSSEIPATWDLLLAADVLYEPALRDQILLLTRAGRRALLADAHRCRTHTVGATPICELEARTLPDVDPPVRRVTISCLDPSPAGERG